MGIKEAAQQIVAHDPKSAGTALTATAVGLSTVMDWLSASVGLAASVAGLWLAVLLIRKARLEAQLLQIELEKNSGKAADRPHNPPTER